MSRPLAQAAGWPDIRQALGRIPPAVLRASWITGVLGMLAVFGAAAFLAPSARVSAAVRMPPAGDLGTDPARDPCDGCGVVEAIRPVDGIEGSPATYAFSVRMKDGSLRDSTTATAGRWRVGDRIILMGGAGHP
jgi:hypothetical protein